MPLSDRYLSARADAYTQLGIDPMGKPTHALHAHIQHAYASDFLGLIRRLFSDLAKLDDGGEARAERLRIAKVLIPLFVSAPNLPPELPAEIAVVLEPKPI